MAPLPCSHHLWTALVRVGTSKAQVGLAKIIAIISTISPIERRGGNSKAARAGEQGFDIDLNLRLGPPPVIGGGESLGNDEEGGGPTVQSVVAADVVAEREESGEESTVEDSGRAPRAVEESSFISPAVRSFEGECNPKEESRKTPWGEAKESSGIMTVPSGKVDDGDEDEELVVEVIKKERNKEAKETKGGSAGEGREEAVKNL